MLRKRNEIEVIKFIDASSFGEDWQLKGDVDEFFNDCHKEMIVVGFPIKEDKTGVMLAQVTDTAGDEQYRNLFFIPKKVITTRDKFKI